MAESGAILQWNSGPNLNSSNLSQRNGKFRGPRGVSGDGGDSDASHPRPGCNVQLAPSSDGCERSPNRSSPSIVDGFGLLDLALATSALRMGRSHPQKVSTANRGGQPSNASAGTDVPAPVLRHDHPAVTWPKTHIVQRSFALSSGMLGLSTSSYCQHRITTLDRKPIHGD